MVGRLDLQDVFKEQAEWRREKAKQYPNDERNLQAAAIFGRLAATVDAIPQGVFVALSELGNVDEVFWTWNGGLRCYATSPLAPHRKPPRTSSDPLLRIEQCDADNRLHNRRAPPISPGFRSGRGGRD